jgi:DNA recombination protein RmuC
MEILTLFLTLLVGLALGAVVGVLWSRSRPSYA